MERRALPMRPRCFPAAAVFHALCRRSTAVHLALLRYFCLKPLCTLAADCRLLSFIHPCRLTLIAHARTCSRCTALLSMQTL